MLALTNQYIVVLDACVLAPMPLCDTLLRLAEEPAFYIPKWSDQILDEVRRTIESWGYLPAQAQRRVDSMKMAFEDAVVIDHEPLIAAMTNHAKDRHVLAAAVKCGANAIVTDNIKDFPAHCLRPFGVEAISPDDFLVHQYHFDKEQIVTTIERQAAKINSAVPALLGRLSVNVPAFASLITDCVFDNPD